MEDNNIPVSVKPTSSGPAPTPFTGRPMNDIVNSSPSRPSTAMPIDISEKKAEIPVTQEVDMPAEPETSTTAGTNSFESTNNFTTSNTDSTPTVDTPIIPTEKSPADLIPGLDPKPSTETPNINTSFDSEAAMKSLDEPVITDAAPALDTSLKNDDMKPPEVIPATQPKQTSKKGKGAVIMVAVLVALALIAGAGYAYIQNNKAAVKPAAQTQVKENTVTKDPATGLDVDNASNALDTELKKVDDTKDYQENDLTDTTLGL